MKTVCTAIALVSLIYLCVLSANAESERESKGMQTDTQKEKQKEKQKETPETVQPSEEFPNKTLKEIQGGSNKKGMEAPLFKLEKTLQGNEIQNQSTGRGAVR